MLGMLIWLAVFSLVFYVMFCVIVSFAINSTLVYLLVLKVLYK